jgi:hypothetical protein
MAHTHVTLLASWLLVLSLAAVSLAYVAPGAHSLQGFVPAERHGKLGLVNDELPRAQKHHHVLKEVSNKQASFPIISENAGLLIQVGYALES